MKGNNMGKELTHKDNTSASKIARMGKNLVGVTTSYHLDSVKDLKKLDTDFVVSVAKAIMEMTEKIAKDSEFSKQYELGKIFNASALAAKSGNKKIRIKDIQKELNIAPRTWHEWVDFYITNTAFKKMLSLEERTCALPTSSMNRELRGNDSDEKFENWNNVISFFGAEPKHKEIVEFNKNAKSISDKVWTVTAEQMKQYVADQTVDEPEPDDDDDDSVSTDTRTAYEKLSNIEKKTARNQYYHETTGVDYAQLWDDHDCDYNHDVPDNLVDVLKDISQKEWKTMFRKGAKIFASDTGNGTDKEAKVWKQFALLVEGGFHNVDCLKADDEMAKLKSDVSAINEDVVAEWFNKNVQ